MKLPADEEDDEEVVGVPEPLEISTTAFLHREPDHDAQNDGHDPSGGTWTGEEIGFEEEDDAFLGVLARRDGQAGEIEHVCDDVDEAEEGDRPSCELVEFDILVERDEVVEGSAAEEGDEVSADREKD